MFLGHAEADGLVNAATVIYREENLFVYAYTVIPPTSFFITNFVFPLKIGQQPLLYFSKLFRNRQLNAQDSAENLPSKLKNQVNRNTLCITTSSKKTNQWSSVCNLSMKGNLCRKANQCPLIFLEV